MNETINCLLTRRSIRAYKPDQISDDDLQLLLDCGINAASGMNAQPWRFTVVQCQKCLGDITKACADILSKSPNEGMAARAKDPNFSPFYKAPTLIIISANDSALAKADCANAAENLCVAAHALGLGSCYIVMFTMAFSGPDGPALLEKLGIPEGFTPAYAVAVGYAAGAEPASPPKNKNVVNYVK